jgi:ubiquitin-conjugating enzyme E2 O
LSTRWWLIVFHVQLRVDGQVEVKLGNTSVVVVPLERLTRLQDGMDNAMSDMWGDQYSDGYGYDGDDDEDIEVQYETGGEGAWERYNGDLETGDEWEDEEEAEEDRHSETADFSSKAETIVDLDPGVHNDDGMDVDLPAVLPAMEPPSLDASMLPVPSIVESSSGPSSGVRLPTEVDLASRRARDISMDDEDTSWQRFAILPQAPADHAFYASKHAQTTKTFMTRLNKEYRVLKSSLPGQSMVVFLSSLRLLIVPILESILVRVYEDRADLLRCLIIGPENTPYENAV